MALEILAAALPAVIQGIGGYFGNKAQSSQQDKEREAALEGQKELLGIKHQQDLEMAKLQAQLSRGASGPTSFDWSKLGVQAIGEGQANKQRAIEALIGSIINGRK